MQLAASKRLCHYAPTLARYISARNLENEKDSNTEWGPRSHLRDRESVVDPLIDMHSPHIGGYWSFSHQATGHYQFRSNSQRAAFQTARNLGVHNLLLVYFEDGKTPKHTLAVKGLW